MKKLILAFIMFASSIALHAQDTLLQSCEKCADALAVCKVERDAFAGELALTKKLNNLYEQMLANAREQSAFWKEAATTRKDIIGLDLRIEQNYREQVAGLKAEVARLRAENDGLRRSRDRRTFFSFGAGLALGQATRFRF